MQECLEHPYFSNLRRDLKPTERDCPELFDESFEKDYPLDVEMPKVRARETEIGRERERERELCSFIPSQHGECIGLSNCLLAMPFFVLMSKIMERGRERILFIQRGGDSNSRSNALLILCL